MTLQMTSSSSWEVTRLPVEYRELPMTSILITNSLIGMSSFLVFSILFWAISSTASKNEQKPSRACRYQFIKDGLSLLAPLSSSNRFTIRQEVTHVNTMALSSAYTWEIFFATFSKIGTVNSEGIASCCWVGFSGGGGESERVFTMWKRRRMVNVHISLND